ncbi:MAG: hypothetical protein IKK89_02715 [Alistipes sp.]|nr:hypothetical protein [Alistipes sp.]
MSKLAERMGGIREYIVYALGSRRAISRCGWLVAMVACMFVAVGCATDKRSAELIAYAEEIAMELPDSALRVVQSIDPESVRGRHDRAHYKLVVAEAHYYRDLIPNRDSIAQPLFDYYIGSDNHAERARAMYQHALVMQAEGENVRAMFSLLEAEKSLTHLDNPRLSGLVHRTKGHIYGAECLFQNELEEYQKSKEYFDKAELPIHSAYALYNIATAYSDLRDYDNAIKYLLKSEEQFSENGYGLYQFETQIELCYNYIQIADLNSCANVFARIDKSAKIGYSYCDYYCIYAILSAHSGNFDDAKTYISKAKTEQIINPMRLAYSEFIIMRICGDDSDALTMYREMIAEQDKFVFNAINNSLLQSQVDLLSGQVASAKEIQQKTRLINYLLAIISAGIVLLFIYYIRNRQRKHQAEIEQYISTIKELQMTTKDLPSQMNDSIDKLYKSRFKELNDLYDIYYDSVGSTRQMKIVFEQINNTINSIKCDKKRLAELEKIVNEYRGNMMSKLLDLCPNLSERQRKIILFSYAGFSLRAIALFMDSNPTQISKDKYKIKGIIKSCVETKDTELFINSL